MDRPGWASRTPQARNATADRGFARLGYTVRSSANEKTRPNPVDQYATGGGRKKVALFDASRKSRCFLTVFPSGGGAKQMLHIRKFGRQQGPGKRQSSGARSREPWVGRQ